MKPFDLEKALAGDPVVTRTGKPVTQLHKFDLQRSRYIVGVLDDSIITWPIDGRYYASKPETQLDLFMASKKRTVWVNLYEDLGGFHLTREEAEQRAIKNVKRIGDKAWPLEIEE